MRGSWIGSPLTSRSRRQLRKQLPNRRHLKHKRGRLSLRHQRHLHLGLSDISQAGVDRDTTLGDIAIAAKQTEIDALNAQSLADRLETDAAITETRDVFLKASAQETLKYQTEVRQIQQCDAVSHP